MRQGEAVVVAEDGEARRGWAGVVAHELEALEAVVAGKVCSVVSSLATFLVPESKNQRKRGAYLRQRNKMQRLVAAVSARLRASGLPSLSRPSSS
jgi:hypothetical protein